MHKSSIRVAVVGLGFGAEFVPIYLHHPDVDGVAICDSDPRRLEYVGEKFGVADRYLDFQEALTSDDWDAVHLVTPIPVHVEQQIAVLESGRHCACTVPMATSIDDLNAVIAARRRSGRNYMMMETAVYCREFLYAQELAERGVLGSIQFLRGAHYQDMEGWPWYWRGLPPLWYGTHAISPLLRLAGTRATKVHCFGTGRMRQELIDQYGNPFPMETGIFRLEGTDVAAEATRSLFHVGREYQESFNVYGENAVFEWGQTGADAPVLFTIEPMEALKSNRGRSTKAERAEVPDYAHRLPPGIGRFTTKGVYDESNPHMSFLQGGGHGGSHPHLVHEFVRSIVEGRRPSIDDVTAANWCAAGICAHESALRDGEGVIVPSFNGA
jgi:predicted dehydrogenase